MDDLQTQSPTLKNSFITRKVASSAAGQLCDLEDAS